MAPWRPLRAWAISARCVARNLPLLVAAAPATPLRVLCIAALDTLRALRGSGPLTRQRRGALAAFLDLQAGANAEWDGKPSAAADALRDCIERAGLASWLAAYRDRVGAFEAGRPAAGGDRRRFEEVRGYRESVARHALAAVAGIALDAPELDAALRATHEDADLAALFGLAMQCQVLDDVFDHERDRAAGLPTFLTASACLRQGLALTRDAARSYGARNGTPAERATPPLRLALRVLSAAAALAVVIRGLGARRDRLPPFVSRSAAKQSGRASP